MAEQQQDAAATTGDAGAEANRGETPADFDAWIQSQGDEIKALYEKKTTGLKSALDDERSTRKTLSKQIADLSRQAEEGSKLRGELEKLSAAQEAANRKAAFYEGAPADVTNLKLAWLAADDAGLVDKTGEADWTALRKQMPELFQVKIAPRGNGGEGSGQNGQGAQPGMNHWIRQAAGRTG